MRERILTLPWRLLMILFLLLPALLPLLRGTGLPCTHDNVLHYYRIAAIDAAWRQGWIFSRWIPNLALGYGYPFFNFREPLPYLVGALLYRTGMPLPLVVGLLYAASLIAAAGGAYVLARDLFGERAAWIAALAYGLGPYLLLDALRRGNMPESVALALLPWLMVTFRRVILGGGRAPFIASVLLLAALFLSHNITSLLFAPLLGGYVILLAWLYRARRAWPWAFAAVFLAVALTAWFWFPALTEQSTVQLHLSRTTRNNDFHYNFATWQEMLFALPTPYDADYLNPPMRVPLGVVQTALAVVGVVVGWRRTRASAEPGDCADGRVGERRVAVIFFALLALAYLWMSSPGSVWLWEAFPMLAFIQFPWRLVGRALLPASLLAAAAFSSAPRLPLAVDRLLFFSALALLALFSWPDTYPPKGFCALNPHPAMTDLYAYEQQGWMGVDPEGSYFPVWVEEHPTDTALADAFARGVEPARLDAGALPSGARVLAAVYRPLQASITLTTPTAFQARWLGFYFPGWRVEIDSIPVAVAPEDDTGLLTFAVPAGEHTLEVRFGMTPARRRVSLVSGAALLVFGLAVWRIHSPADDPTRVTGAALSALSTASFSPSPLAVALLAVVLLVLRLLVVERTSNPVHHSRLAAGVLPEVDTPLAQPFTGGLTLLGYDIASAELPADGEVQIDLLWQAREIPSLEYRTVILLTDAEGRYWSPAGTMRPRGYEPTPPTTMWLPGQYAYDPHIVQPLPGTPPGEYSIVVSLFDKSTLTPASVVGADGNPSGPDLTLGTLKITPPQTPTDLPALDVPADAVLRRCGALGLWTMTADRARAAPGEIVGLRWVWEALARPQDALLAMLTVSDAAGSVARTWELPLAAAWWPTDRWSAGERWVGRPVVRLPGGLESGTYRLAVHLPGCDEALAETFIEVRAPERVWQAPDDLLPADVIFSDQVRLVGYALEPATPVAGKTLTVRLAWQAMAEMESSYRVFVHLLGSDGHILAQSDGEPANWMRPTTGWAVGEIVVETREIAVPATLSAGGAILRVGLYLPDGPRLITTAGEDAFVLGSFDF
ncbi:MAG TPA: hypothetical protein PLH19_03645 [Anaerolineae bacterium]|nr:hypothetical protein [Anaerolineae bacterium]HQH37615.1 hypothetical protein [Anaerolineae bacterium]